jgi:hypothetical protein
MKTQYLFQNCIHNYDHIKRVWTTFVNEIENMSFSSLKITIFNLVWQLIEEDRFIIIIIIIINGNYDHMDDVFVMLRLFTQISTINISKSKDYNMNLYASIVE